MINNIQKNIKWKWCENSDETIASVNAGNQHRMCIKITMIALKVVSGFHYFSRAMNEIERKQNHCIYP